MKLFSIIVVLIFGLGYAVEPTPMDSRNPKYFLGSSAFVAFNLLPDPADFYQLDLGWYATPSQALVLQLITWNYHAPLGIPYWGPFGDTAESYSGSIRAFGVGIDYQHYFFKRLYGMAQVGNFYLIYTDTDNHTQNWGYQLFLQARVGYRIEFGNRRFYLEPSVACNWWPVQTGMPDSFRSKEKDWPNYFLLEPGLGFGMQW